LTVVNNEPQTFIMLQISEETRIARLIERLAAAHAELPSEQVTVAVNDALASFSGASVREFVPLLVERRARKQLVNM
jgi:hypothetical protein